MAYGIYKMHIKDKDECKKLKQLSVLSCNLYNRTNYIVRQAITKRSENIEEYKDLIEHDFIEPKKLPKRMGHLKDVDKYAFPDVRTADNIIRHLSGTFNSYFALLKRNKKNNSNKKVGLPRYIKEEKKPITPFISIDKQSLRRKNGLVYFPNKMNLKPFKDFIKETDNIIEVNVVNKNGEFYYYIVHERNEPKITNINNENILSIDIGINNLLTCVENNGTSFIISGRKLKSINQHCNKELSKAYSYVGDKGISNRINKLLHKRNNIMNYELHGIANYIVNYCIKEHIGTITIGKNKDWKQNCELGKINNQHFVQIPHAKLIEIIKYKAEENGIKVIEVCESYTSKCDALAKEEIGKHENYCGKRIKRGLFQSQTGHLVNADVNGALNILRKIIGDSFIDKLNMEKLLSPYKIKA